MHLASCGHAVYSLCLIIYLIQRFKRLFWTSFSDGQSERLWCNEAINECDLGPAEFQLETQSIVRRVLMTYINGFLVARDQCLGTRFVSWEWSVKHHYSLSVFASPTHTRALEEPLQPVDMRLPVGFPCPSSQVADKRGQASAALIEASRLLPLSLFFYFFLSVVLSTSPQARVFIPALCSWTLGQNAASSPWVSDLPNFWSLIKVCQTEFFKKLHLKKIP